MATKKVTDLNELTSTASGDFIHVVDVSDGTDDSAGSSKKVRISNFLPDTGVSSNTYGDASNIPVLTVNSKGQITDIEEVSVVGGIAALTGDTTASGSGSVSATVTKINGQTPATVATTGAYADLSGRPSLATVATSGAYTDLTGKPALGSAALLAAGSANGVATLDGSGLLPSAQLPSNACKLDAAQVYTKQHNTSGGALTDAASIAWNLDDAQTASVTLGGNRTLANPTNMVARGTYFLIVKQDATGSRTLAYGTAYKWASGLAPVLSTSANAVDILSFISDGTSLFGVAQYAFS